MSAPSDAAPAAIRARLFGHVEFAVGDRPIPEEHWPRRTARSLLLLLLTTPGYRLSRDRVLELLWPDAAPKSALNALYVALHALRRVLEPDLRTGRASAYLEASGEVIRLRPELVGWVNVTAFEAELVAAIGPHRRERLAAALALYADDLLADEPYVDWPVARREQLRSAWREAVLAYAEDEREAGRPLLVVPAIERVLHGDPTDETAYRALMRAFAAAGRREDALRQFDRCVAALQEDLGIEPGEETSALAAEIRAAPAAPVAPVKVASRVDHLPAPPNPLVGRGREVEEVLELLCRREVRLVTLTGPGGVGKTRLAIEAASLAAGEFAGGVCFVSLAPIRDPALVLPAIVHALGLDEADDAVSLDLLRSALGDQELLLLLDNFEQVLDAAPTVAELLTACPRLTILVTSRAPLHLRAEHELPIAPLPIPDPARTATAGALARYAAVELFVQRARAVRPAFALTDANAPALGALCARLDGLPLAIELAAAHCRHLSPEALVAGLADRFALLAGGFRDLPPRQRTMRAAIAWSYDLLTPEEQATFRRLSVFVDGFAEGAQGAGYPLGAALGAQDEALPSAPAAVCAPCAPSILVEKGLLRRDDGPDGARYAMLETIREFGGEALAASGEQGEVRRAHTAWCLALAERVEPELTGPNQAAWLERLDIEHANLQAALDWALSEAAPDDAALRLAAALWRFWWSRGYAREGRAWLERALTRSGEVAEAVRAKALAAAAELAEGLADYRQAEAWYDDALVLLQATGDDRGIAFCLNGLGAVVRALGELDRADGLSRRALAILRRLGDRRGVASALNNLAAIAYFRGDAAQAGTLWEEAVDLVRALGDQRSICALLGNLGALALMRGDPRRATELHEEALALSRRMDDFQGTTHALVNLGGALYESGEYDRAAAIYEEALARCRQTGEVGSEAIVLYDLGKLAETLGTVDQAAQRFAESLSLFWHTGNLPGVAAGLERLGAVTASRGRAEQAVRLFAAAATIREATGAARETVDHGEYERQLAAVHAALGEAAFAAAWDAGTRQSRDEAVAEALTWATPDEPGGEEGPSLSPGSVDPARERFV